MESLIEDSSSLKKVSQTLYLLHRRNKNQHRLSKWWKWFAMLHRSVKKLLADLQRPDETLARARTLYLNDVLQPRCYQSFSKVVSDRQFAALGLVLVGVLAELNVLLRTRRNFDDPRASFETEATDSSPVWEGTSPLEDLGQRLERPLDILDDLESLRLDEEGMQATGSSTNSLLPPVTLMSSSEPNRLRSTTIRKPKSSRKKASKSRNAIDEVFNGIE
ncbi:hypothetical protein MMC18_008143 [Xylographa bjoerkii]|nr:hypothetical protein [Xylographa bjoerkii]